MELGEEPDELPRASADGDMGGGSIITGDSGSSPGLDSRRGLCR